MSDQSFNKVDLPPWLTVIIRGTINVPIIYLSSRICARNLWRRSHWIWTHTPVETHQNHWPLRGWVVVRRWGEGGEQPQAKYTGSAQVNKTREKPPEIYSAQIWQVFHNWNDWTWLYGDEWSLSKDCLCNTAVCCPTARTYLVQCQQGIFLCQCICQFLQAFCFLYVIFQCFIETDVLLEHRACGIIQLPKKFTAQTDEPLRHQEICL